MSALGFFGIGSIFARFTVLDRTCNESASRRHARKLATILSLVIAAVTLAVTCQVTAQIGRATIFGTITDQQGGVIVGAEITITHIATGTSYNTISNERGFYTVPGLPVGNYEVTAELPGFKRNVQRGIALQVDDRAQVDVRLEIGEVADTVEVFGTAALVDTGGATVGKVIENERMVSLPISGRSALTLVVLTPNVRSHTVEAHGFADRGALVSAFSIAGGAVGVNEATLDGTTNINPRSGDINVNLAVDAIEEFKVQSGVMSSEYGFTTGGVVNMVTKSGTNSFRGSLYEFLRHDRLDARNAFAQDKSPLRYNQYGGALGGPIIRGKSFFFANYEEWRMRSAYSVIGTVPTEAQRQGDFSQLRNASGTLIPIYDPATTRPNPEGSGFIRDQFDGNVIPSSRLDPVAQNILKFYPPPNRTPSNPFTQTENFIGSFGFERKARQLTAKVDQHFSARNQLSVRYSLWHHMDDNAGAGSGYFPDKLARVRDDNYVNHNFNVSNNHFFSPTLINDFRFGVVRQRFEFNSLAAGQNVTGQLGLPDSVPNLTLPVMNVAGIQRFPSGNAAFMGLIPFYTLQLAESITKIQGNHTIKMGGEYRKNSVTLGLCSLCSGSFNFNPRLTGNPQALAGTGSALSSFVLGAVANASVQVNIPTISNGSSYSLYFQDDWKFSQRLTLNLGLRYDYQQIPSSPDNTFSRFNPTAVNPENGLTGRMEYAGVDFGSTLIRPDRNDFSPRLGFAWDVLGTRNTVLRGGYGIYYPLTFTFARRLGSAGFGNNTTTYGPPGGNLDFPALHLVQGFPFAPLLPLGAALGPSAFQSQNVSFNEEHGRTPYSQQFTLTLQNNLPGAMLLEVGYAGNKGSKMPGGNWNLNQLHPEHLTLGDSLRDPVPNPYVGLVSGAFGGPTITREQSLRPFPYYNNITVTSPHLASSSYHSFLLNLERRFSDGMVFLASYTFGKLLNDGVRAGFGFAGIEATDVIGFQNSYNQRAERSVDSVDSGKRFVLSGIYELPMGIGKRWASSNSPINAIIGGWRINGVLTMQDGLPLVIRGANNITANRPNSTGTSAKLDSSSRSAAQWFDTTQFVNPPDYTFGNVGRTLPDVRSPGIFKIDTALTKDTRIREGLDLQLRVEAFNLTNRVNLLGPNVQFVPGPDGMNASATFGRISAAREARTMQLGLKLIF